MGVHKGGLRVIGRNERAVCVSMFFLCWNGSYRLLALVASRLCCECDNSLDFHQVFGREVLSTPS